MQELDLGILMLHLLLPDSVEGKHLLKFLSIQDPVFLVKTEEDKQLNTSKLTSFNYFLILLLDFKNTGI